MINFENTEVMGWEAAIRGMRNPMNSWGKSDSGLCEDFQCGYLSGKDERPMCPAYISDECEQTGEYIIGPNDMDLMRRLTAGGPVHAKYRRMITVYVDITAPLYWWKEFDAYKVGTVANSCSTMHKITDKEFDRGDFSHDHIPFGSDAYSDTWDIKTSDMFFCVNEEDEIYLSSEDILDYTIMALNHYRKKYLETSDEIKKLQESFIVVAIDAEEKALKIRELQKKKKQYWWQMIQLLPSSYNQKRTVMLNYEVLAHIYKDRKYHKLDEWREHKKSTCSVDRNRHCENPKEFLLCEDCAVGKGFCDWIKTLPYPELICGEYANKEETTPNCFVPIPGDK